ncbi:hypothetical protein Dsin_001199 [Dipteronia sinensis]|uniref:Uncharacterized protein n=1 Tax=Dipteronia sinensis TaxID=43782 RepID=A0AAE0B3J1_9ROSI|nr:hypothetical protein Dsin_001199 [Dipteronia sinensis]
MCPTWSPRGSAPAHNQPSPDPKLLPNQAQIHHEYMEKHGRRKASPWPSADGAGRASCVSSKSPRPLKPKDLFATPVPSKKKSSGGSGRPRDRPPKKAKVAPPVAATSAPAAAPTDPSKGRGQPPKVKPVVAPVAG